MTGLTEMHPGSHFDRRHYLELAVPFLLGLLVTAILFYAFALTW
jgi:hypothetical protein